MLHSLKARYVNNSFRLNQWNQEYKHTKGKYKTLATMKYVHRSCPLPIICKEIIFQGLLSYISLL
jgi:hypothetical protein